MAGAPALRGGQPPAEFRSAEAALDTARRLTPDAYRVWAGLGELYTEWGSAGDAARFAQADQAYRRATALFPGSAVLYTGWGLSSMAQGRLTEATARFRRATSLDQTDGWAYWHLGDALLAQGDLAAAEDAYLNALHWVPDLSGARLGLAQVYDRRR